MWIYDYIIEPLNVVVLFGIWDAFLLQSPYSMLLRQQLSSSLLFFRFSRWDIFLLYGRRVDLCIMVKTGKLWGVSYLFFIAVSVSSQYALFLSMVISNWNIHSDFPWLCSCRCLHNNVPLFISSLIFTMIES